jgi:hypothetical protein
MGPAREKEAGKIAESGTHKLSDPNYEENLSIKHVIP